MKSAVLSLLGAASLSVSSCVGMASQTAAPTALPAALRDHMKNERFDIVTSIRGLPLGVRDGLQTLFGNDSLDIGESGSEIQGTSAANPKLPLRRLVAAGCSPDHCLVHYERGGATSTWLVVLFHWTPAATRFEWGGNAGGSLRAIADVKNAALSGAVKGPVSSW